MTDGATKAGTRRGREISAHLLLALLPFVITTAYVYLTPLPPPRFGWVIIPGSVLLGASTLILVPMTWPRRVLVAFLYMALMLVLQFFWVLSLGCAVRGACI